MSAIRLRDHLFLPRTSVILLLCIVLQVQVGNSTNTTASQSIAATTSTTPSATTSSNALTSSTTSVSSSSTSSQQPTTSTAVATTSSTEAATTTSSSLLETTSSTQLATTSTSSTAAPTTTSAAPTTSTLAPTTSSSTVAPTTTPAPAEPLGPLAIQPGEPVLLSSINRTAAGTYVLVLGGASPTEISITFPRSAVFPRDLTVTMRNASFDAANWTALNGDSSSTVSDLVGLSFGGNYTGPPFIVQMRANRLAGARRSLLQSGQQYRINNLESTTQACNCTTDPSSLFSCTFVGGGLFAVAQVPDRMCPNVIIVPTPPPPRPRPYIEGSVIYVTCGIPFTYDDWKEVLDWSGFAFTFSCGENEQDPQIKFDRTFRFPEEWWFSLTNIVWQDFAFPNTWEADRMVSDILHFNQTSEPDLTLEALRSSIQFLFHPKRQPEVIPIEGTAARRACATAGYEYRVAFEADGAERSCSCSAVAACLDEIPCRDARTGHYALRLQPIALCAPPDTSPPPRATRRSNIGAVLGGVFAGIVVICVCAWLYYRYQTRWKELEKRRKREAKMLPPPPMLKVHLGKTGHAIPEKAHTSYFVRKPPDPPKQSLLDKLKAKCFGNKDPQQEPDVEAEVGVNEGGALEGAADAGKEAAARAVGKGPEEVGVPGGEEDTPGAGAGVAEAGGQLNTMEVELMGAASEAAAAPRAFGEQIGGSDAGSAAAGQLHSMQASEHGSTGAEEAAAAAARAGAQGWRSGRTMEISELPEYVAQAKPLSTLASAAPQGMRSEGGDSGEELGAVDEEGAARGGADSGSLVSAGDHGRPEASEGGVAGSPAARERAGSAMGASGASGSDAGASASAQTLAEQRSVSGRPPLPPPSSGTQPSSRQAALDALSDQGSVVDSAPRAFADQIGGGGAARQLHSMQTPERGEGEAVGGTGAEEAAGAAARAGAQGWTSGRTMEMSELPEYVAPAKPLARRLSQPTQEQGSRKTESVASAGVDRGEA